MVGDSGTGVLVSFFLPCLSLLTQSSPFLTESGPPWQMHLRREGTLSSVEAKLRLGKLETIPNPGAHGRAVLPEVCPGAATAPPSCFKALRFPVSGFSTPEAGKADGSLGSERQPHAQPTG